MIRTVVERGARRSLLMRLQAKAAWKIMANRGKLALRTVAIIMSVAALLWAAEIVRQAMQFDDGGPPAGAICMAVPAFVLIIGAGAVWSSTNRRNVQRGVNSVHQCDSQPGGKSSK